MSEEQFKIWKQVEAKGLEKLGNIEKALLAKEGFEKAHEDYCDFVDRPAETTGRQILKRDPQLTISVKTSWKQSAGTVKIAL